MAEEFDRNLLPNLFQTTLSVSLGAMSKGIDLVSDPPTGIAKMVTEMKSMFTVPDYVGEGLPEKAQAMAGIWVGKGANFLAECKIAGEKFTEGK